MPSENALDSAEFEPKRPTANDCLTDLRIDRYLQGRLEDADMETLEAHISLCPACLARFEEEEDLRKTMAPAARLVEEEGRRAEDLRRAVSSPPWWQTLSGRVRLRWTYAAAASLVALGLLVVSPALRESRSPESVALRALRGAPAPATAAPNRPLLLRADLEGLDPRTPKLIVLVDSVGASIATRPIAAGEREPVWALSSGLRSGSYWVRVAPASDPSAVLREFALRIR